MMAGKLERLKDLPSKINCNLNDFEMEEGQTDGTLAHALERIISWVGASNGADIATVKGKPKFKQNYGYNWLSESKLNAN